MLTARIGWQMGNGANLCIVEKSEDPSGFLAGRRLPRGWACRVTNVQGGRVLSRRRSSVKAAVEGNTEMPRRP
jgi:hypothetical protein